MSRHPMEGPWPTIFRMWLVVLSAILAFTLGTHYAADHVVDVNGVLLCEVDASQPNGDTVCIKP